MKTEIQKVNTGSERIRWIDTIRLWLMFEVYSGHLCDEFTEQYYYHPVIMFIQGVPMGKFAVQFFGLLLGFFATKAGRKGKKGFISKKYLYFFISGLLINSVYYILSRFGIGNLVSMKDVLYNSFWLGHGVYETFWCVKFYFVGAVICYINGRGDCTLPIVIGEFIAFLIIGYEWISACVLGTALVILIENDMLGKVFGKWYYRILVLIPTCLVFAFNTEGFYSCIFLSLIALLIMLALFYSPRLTEIMSFKPLSYWGRFGMEIYILHPLVYTLLGGYLFELLTRRFHLRYVWLMVWIACFVVLLILSFPVKWLIDRCLGFADSLEKRLIPHNNDD